MANCRYLILLTLCAAVLTSAGAAYASLTPPAQIIGAVEAFLEQAVVEYLQRSELQGRHEIRVNRLDSRLRLAQCSQALSVQLESPAQPLGRVTTRVRCDGHAPWTVFVPAEVRLYRPVLVTTRPLARLGTVSASDLNIVERDIGQLPHGYLSEPAEAIGKNLTRQVGSDQVLTPRHLQIAAVVSKGDQVVISARSGGVNVRMPGEALSDGAPGQQIQVRNTRSQRVVRARVVGAGQVEVDM